MLIIAVIGWLAVWSNHFESSFHADDFPTIAGNQFVQHLSSVPRFFTNPRISSMDKDSAAYRPLLSTWFALDYRLFGGKPFVFQAENFLWFTAVLAVMFALFRLIPGVNFLAAAFATLLFGLHPVTADTVNYALQRGVLMASFGVISGMLLWVVWPWRLPQHLPLKLKRVPQHGFDAYLRNNLPLLEARYLKFIHAPIGLYLWPVIPALLADAATAVFAPILIAYILLFETKRNWRHAIPAGVICGGYWIFQLVFTWNLGEFSRVPAPNYWFTQPWVAMRDLSRFVVPVHLSAGSDLPAFAHFWDPLAIAGYLGVAALAGLATLTARREKWRAVSFGIWWFLLALLPDALVPHRALETDWRMFLPFAGLALAVAGIVSIAMEALEQSPMRLPLSVAGGTVAVALLAVSGWATVERNEVWESEPALWTDVIAKSPHNGRALMNYGLTRLAARNQAEAFDYLQHAGAVSPGDPTIEINLALAYGRRGRVADAESQFQQALRNAPAWSPAYSAYSQWLFDQNRAPEALKMAVKAVSLDAYDLAGRRILMDIMANGHRWRDLKQFADDTLRLFPDDPDGQRSLLVAQTGLDQIGKTEVQAKSQPTVDHYLALSVLYFQSGRYGDCVNASREALKLNPNQAEAYSNLAAAYHAMGKLDETITALQEAVRLNPALPTVKSNLEIELAVKQNSGH